ncbi:MAG: hypothetical protein K1X88_36225, partial [Nannocystaceae bacterium]|nr:hypothetical protein [Nannocystaceae bacterium]
MRELVLWRHLEAGQFTPEVLAATLAHAADEHGRATLLAHAGALCDAGDAAARRAGLALLAGTTGIVGLRRIVAALGDDDERVRAEAVRALAACAALAPMRYAHALFHARADVRTQAVAQVPEGARTLLAWARADPLLREACADAPWPEQPLPLLLDLWRRGAVSAAAAAAALSQCTVAAIRSHLAIAEQRAPAGCEAYVAASIAGAAVDLPPGEDCLDTLFEFVAAAGEGAAVGPLADAIGDAEEAALRVRGLVATVAIGSRHGWSEGLSRLALRCDARAVALPGIPLAIRRAMVPLLWTRGGASLPTPLVMGLLAGPLVRDDDGVPSLEAAAAVASLLPERRVRALIDAFGEPAVHALATATPSAWDAVCRLPFETAHLWWLEQLEREAPAAVGLARAVACMRWAAAQREEIDRADGPLHRDPVGVALGLLELATTAPWSASSAAFTLVAGRLAELHRAPLAIRVLPALVACPCDNAFARAMLEATVRTDAAASLLQLPTRAVVELLRWFDEALTPSPALVAALAAGWRAASEPSVARWVARVSPRAEPESRPRVWSIHRLGLAEHEAIAGCDAAALEAALAPALAAPSFGLTDALARREPAPSLAACVALVGCADGLVPVARELERFGEDADEFTERLRLAVLTMWRDCDAVPPLVDAIAVGFERHAQGFATWLCAEEDGWSGVLLASVALGGRLARRWLWDACASVLLGWMWRGMLAPLREGFVPAIVPQLVARLDTELGTSAARILGVLVRSGIARGAVEAATPQVLAAAAACTRETLAVLRQWLPLPGVPGRAQPARSTPRSLAADERVEVAHGTDLDALARACVRGSEAVVHAAVLRLLELGEAGELRLVACVRADGAGHEPMFESIALWSSPRALAELAGLCRDATVDGGRRWRVAIELLARDAPGSLGDVLALVGDAAVVGRTRVPDVAAVLARADGSLTVP